MADRHQFRADWHDYNGGIYFVTICCADKQHLFGRIVGTRFIASTLGKIVIDHISTLPSHYNNVEIWNHVVMPNHVHMIIYIGTQTKLKSTNVGCLKAPRHGEPCEDNHHNSMLATVVGAFKAGVSRCARTRYAESRYARTRLIASLPVWQTRFHEHIIRNQRAYENIMYYIDTNVQNWCYDRFNPERIGDYPVGTRFIASTPEKPETSVNNDVESAVGTRFIASTPEKPETSTGNDVASAVGTRFIASTSEKPETSTGIREMNTFDTVDAMNRVPTTDDHEPQLGV